MKEDHYDAVVPSPLGRLGIHTTPQGLAAIEYLGRDVLLKPAKEPVARLTAEALQRYFDTGELLDLPLAPAGTPFQRRVWQLLREIPLGRTLTYGDVADRIGSGPRAVGGACRSNPIPVLVPCHRVVGKADAGGYSGQTQGPMMARKQWLLAHEGVINPLPIAL